MKKASSFVIVGAGSAGCTLARRILEFDKTATVKLIETGKRDRGRWDSWTIQMPSALTYNVADTRYNYDFHTSPQKNLDNREIHQPRGKVLGGSSSINAMVYIRGHALDFERWAKTTGYSEWDYASVLPYFKRAQRHALGANAYRGASGPLHVRAYDEATTTNELFNVFREAGVQAGHPRTDDVNGFSQYGFGPFDMTVTPNGVRCSASLAYLHTGMPAEMQARLEVVTGRAVHRLVMDDKLSCTGVLTDDGSTHSAEREVILCAGAIGSPQLLMLSGIGPAAHLAATGIKPVLDLAEVGQNLQDHLECYLQYKCLLPVTLYPIGNWTLRYLHRRVGVGLQWFATGRGLAASNQFEIGGFIRARPGVAHPDVQLHFIPGAVLGQLEFLPFHAFQVHVGTLRPESRGSIRLQSADPRVSPVIDPNYLDPGTPDLEDMRLATLRAHEVVLQRAFDPYRGELLSGSLEMLQGDQSKLDAWLRSSTHSAYHPSCTCAMGRVVDSVGRVFGTQQLRVVDASIMPDMTSGNLNAPTIMIAEKIADHIVGREPLAKEREVKFHRF